MTLVLYKAKFLHYVKKKYKISDTFHFSNEHVASLFWSSLF